MKDSGYQILCLLPAGVNHNLKIAHVGFSEKISGPLVLRMLLSLFKDPKEPSPGTQV